MNPRTSVLVVALAAMVSVLPRSASALPPIDRHNWSAGVAYGVGHADIDFVNQDITVDGERGGTPQFHISRMIGSRFMLGIANRQWMDEGGLYEGKIRCNTQSLSLMLTVYPGNLANWTSGFYLQGGYGFANARISLLERAEGGVDEHGNTYVVVRKEDEGGTAVGLGAGYEFRISSHFAAGVNVSYNQLSINGEIFDGANFVPGGIHLNWYF
ncbi:MAG TPA: outer membrane beta-barrel protein [Candidatus Eisenbacteria bacterium]